MARTVVWDRWWPHRFGTVQKRNKTSVYVKWDDGEVSRYDRDHKKFLQTKNGPLVQKATR